VSVVIPVILNSRSGTGNGDDNVADTVRAAFAAHGLQAQLHLLEEGGDLDELLDRALEGRPRCLVAAGGDGTINAVAARVLREPGLTLGVLPAGTLNHFARDLGLPVDLTEAAGVIARGGTREVDVGEVNEQLFLNNSSVGLYATMVSKREHAQKHHGMGKWTAMLKATWEAIRAPQAFDLTVDSEGTTLHRRTPFVFVGNNDYVMQGLDAGKRESLEDGRLSVYVLRPYGTLGLLWLGLRPLFGRVPDRRDLDGSDVR